MVTLRRIRRTSRIHAPLVLAAGMVAATVGTSFAASPNQSFVVTACATRDDRLEFAGTWSGIRAVAWSFFIESSEGSGGTSQPLPEPSREGTVTGSTGPSDVTAIASVTVSLLRTTGANGPVAATQTLAQPASGWADC